MTPQEMWTQYTPLCPDAASIPWEAWSYGETPDQLAALTLSGVKTATASLHVLYTLDGEPMPQIGDYSIILNAKAEAVCIIRNTAVHILPYRNVPARHAYLEGEGDRSLAHWQKVHEAFFCQELALYGLSFTDDIAVVCEEFEVMYP